MLRGLACCCAFLLTIPAVAAAEWHFTPMAGGTFAGRTSLLDLERATGKAHKQLGGAVTLLGGGLLGVEGVVVYIPGFFQRGDLDLLKSSHSVSLMGNAVLTAPRRWTEYSLRPFVSGGLGLVHASVEDAVLPVRTNLAGFNVGGGAIGFLSPRTGVRFDLRYFSSLHPTEQGPISFGSAHLSYMTLSVGVVLRR
jgi:hypothetical protein